MSNPLLRPGDPRFSKPSIHDALGKNLFGEPGQEVGPVHSGTVPAGADTNPYSPSHENSPYQPRFVVSQGHRGVLLFVLSLVGLAGSFSGVLSLTGVWVMGWVLTVLAMVPAGCAVALGNQDLRAMWMGAMDGAGRSLTLTATWLGGLSLFCSLAMMGTVLYFAIYFVMSLF